MSPTQHLYVAGIAQALVVIIVGTTTADAQTTAPATVVTCASTSSERQHCVADTSGGVALARST